MSPSCSTEIQEENPYQFCSRKCKDSFLLKRVLFAEAAEGSCGTTRRHLLEADTFPTEFPGFFNPLTWNNHPRADIVTSPAETAGFGPNLEGHTYFSTHSSPSKPEGFSVHLLITHPNTEAAENTTIILHGKSNLEQPHTGRYILRHLYVRGAGD